MPSARVPIAVALQMRAAIYCRVSSAEQAKGFSLDAQYREVRDYCARQSYHVVRVYKESESGSTADRPAFQALLDAAIQGKFQVVVVWRRDRWARNGLVAALGEKLLSEAGIRLEASITGPQDRSPEAELFNGMQDLFAQFESRKITVRCAMGRLEAAKQGFWPTRAPSGYRRNPVTRKLEVDEKSAARVREAIQLIADGMSSHDVGLRVGVDHTVVCGWVNRLIYSGTLVWHDVVIPNAFPGLVSPELHQRARERLAATNAAYGR